MLKRQVQGAGRVFPIFVGGKPVTTSSTLKVVDKYTQKVGYEVSLAGPQEIETSLQLASQATLSMRDLPNYKRKEILLYCASELQKREDELLHSLCVEAGKPLKDARAELGRAYDTFTVAAEEAVRQYGEYIPLDISSRNPGFSGIVRRFPIGLISMITPFNFPINLVAHKVAPAIAAGCPFVLKPNDVTPMGALLIGDILSNAGLPEGAFSVLPCKLEDAKKLSTDPRIQILSFTGSELVGFALRGGAGRMKVLLELGGDAACVVDAGSDVDHVVSRVGFGAFYYGGQSCISVQRVYVHESIYDEFKQKLVAHVATLKKGDPFDENTFIGPLISENSAKRLESWVQEAKEKGGKLLVGGNRDGSFFDPTIMEDVPASAKLACEEAFGPICVLYKFSDFNSAISEVNKSRFGLQAGVFTNDWKKAWYAYDKLEVGGVVINDIPSVRVDAQPYGGIKSSGVGREGLRCTIEEFTEPKILLTKDMYTGKL